VLFAVFSPRPRVLEFDSQLIGVSQYESGLAPLPGALEDLKMMQQVLQNTEISDFDDVSVLHNPDRQKMEEAISQLFSGRAAGDLVLLYFSGHAVKDERGKLFLTTCITRKNQRGELEPATAVVADSIHYIMDKSRSKRQVIILDCCFSGAFAEGLAVKDGSTPQPTGKVEIEAQLGGEGRAILTSSTAVQYSFDPKGAGTSIYTRYLLEGIETGAADQDRDGWISVDELHEFAKKKVQGAYPEMKPEIYAAREGYSIQLLKTPPGNPKTAYRKEVERYVSRGEISKTGRRILDKQRDKWSLSAEEALVIETEALKPFREYARKLQEYEQAFCEVFDAKYSLSEHTREELRELQRVLGLRNEDIADSEERMRQLSGPRRHMKVLPSERKSGGCPLQLNLH